MATPQDLLKSAGTVEGNKAIFDAVSAGQLSEAEVRATLGDAGVDWYIQRHNITLPSSTPTQGTPAPTAPPSTPATPSTPTTPTQTSGFDPKAFMSQSNAALNSTQELGQLMNYLRGNAANSFGLDELGGLSPGEIGVLFDAAERSGFNADQIIEASGGWLGKQALANYLQTHYPNHSATQGNYKNTLMQQISSAGVSPTVPNPVTGAPATGGTNTGTPTQGGTTPPPTQGGGQGYVTPITGGTPAGIRTPLPNTTLTKEQLNEVAAGNVAVPGANLAAIPVDMSDTITDASGIQQIGSPTQVNAQATGPAPQITTQDVTAQTADTPQSVAPAQITDVDQGQQMAPTQVAQGQLSEGAIATAETVTPSANIEGATVDIPAGATVEAAIGTMSPEDLAQAAQVAGLETARINEAKRQLRKAGLTDAEILAIGDNVDALEQRLGDFSEEQLGLIAGLPVEALVSTQMEQLLAGMENGDVPLWAKPAVDAVTQMLARRGLSASTVGRDALFNAVIQSALPLAQQNAQAITASAMQQREFIQQGVLQEAAFRQQATLQNAQNTFNLKINNLNNEQQANLANSQFLQTVSLTEANNRQQAAVQNAINLTQLDLATVDQNTKLAIQNAQAFLQMDLTNLSNQQQGIILDAQYEQQRLLSAAAANNAAKQFNAASENQVNMFMAELASNMAQFNTAQLNAMRQFNAAEANKAAALNAGNDIQVQQFNAQLMAQVDQFNSQQELMVQQWNAANAQAIEQSNIQWRRQANTANTAAQNAINQQNVQNAFSLTAQAQAALWQELRDAATFTFQAYENQQDREAQLYAVALGNESAAARNYDSTTHLMNLARQFFMAGA